MACFSAGIAESEDAARSIADAKSASERIYIYSQHNGSETDRAWAQKALADGNTLMSSGCHIYSYAHAVQWLSGDDYDAETAGKLLDELIGVYNMPWDGNAMARYRNYVSSAYCVKRVGIPGTKASVLAHFEQGGVLILNPGGHYILAVDAVEADLDGNGESEPWLHIVDSVCGTSMSRLGYWGLYMYTFDTKEKIDNVTKEMQDDAFHGGTWDCGGEYWMPYSVYNSNAVRCDAAFVPDNEGRIDGNLRICDVEYPSVYPVNDQGWRVQGGYIASHFRLISVQSQIADSEGKVVSDSGAMSINGYRYAVQALENVTTHDNGVRFSRLWSAGEYQWILTAEDASGAKVTVTMPISVVNNGAFKTETMSSEPEEDDKTEAVSSESRENAIRKPPQSEDEEVEDIRIAEE